MHNSVGWIAPLDGDVFQTNIGSVWELDLAGGLRRSVKAAEANVRAAEEARNDVQVLVSTHIGKNYIALRGAQGRLAILQDSINLQRDSLELTRVRQKAGLAADLDVIRAQAQLNQTSTEVPSLEEEIDRSAHALSVLLGTPTVEFFSELRVGVTLP